MPTNVFRKCWDENYKDLEYYPYPQFFCHCPLQDKLKVKPSHRRDGIPKFNLGHKSNKNISDDEIKRRIEWDEKYGDHIGEHYPDHFCHCPCKGQMIIRASHLYSGIPKYLNNHQMLDSKTASKTSNSLKEFYSKHPGFKAGKNAPMYNKYHTEEAKLAIAIGHQGHYISDFQLELNRDYKDKHIEEIAYFRSFRDFVKLSCSLWQNERPIQYIRASKFIRKVLKEKGLCRFDIIIFINFFAGVTQWQLSEHFRIDVGEIRKRLLAIEKIFPEAFIKGPYVHNVEDMIHLDSRWNFREDEVERF